MGRKLPVGEGEVARTACARGVLRGGVDERTGEALTASVVAERVGWCAGLVSGMAAGLLAGRWNAVDVGALASGGRCRRRRGWRCVAWAGPPPRRWVCG